MRASRSKGHLSARLGMLALAGMAVFLATSAAAQFLRHDLDWIAAPNSFYLIGPWSGMVRAGYYAMAAALVLFAVAAYRELTPEARSAAPLLLFVLGGVALAVTVIAHTNQPDTPPTLQGYVHGIAAAAAFLCTATAMLLQAWRLRSDPRWRRWWKPAFAYAAVCFALLWLSAARLNVPHGLGEKVLIVLITGWLMAAAYRLACIAGAADGGTES